MNATTARETYDKKVLRIFVVDGRLTAIPAQRKKRDVILRHLVESFDRERVYREPEVNAIIGRLHHDFATLRRELVDSGLLVRQRGEYARPD